MTKPEQFYAESPKAWRKWLEKNHVLAQAVWLIYYRTSSSKPSLTWSQAVDEALCFGWIDSVKKTINSESYMQYFSKRKPNSIWSSINKDKVDQLLKENKMTQAGLDAINTAKENGSWSAYDHVAAMLIPEGFSETLAKHEGASAYFEQLSNSKKKLLLYWIASAKRAETKEKRMLEIAANASEGKMPAQFR